MGREPVTRAAEDSSGQSPEAEGSASGEHTPSGYARTLLDLVASGASGVLTTRHDEHERSVSLVNGWPVAVLSTLEEESLPVTLVTSGRVESGRMEWMKKHCGPDEPLVEGLLAAGSLSQEDLDAHLQEHLFRLVSACLGWSTGEWTWTDAGPAAVSRFDPSLLPEVDALEALLHGVQQAFERSALRTFAQDTDAGHYVADPRLTGGSPPTWLPKHLSMLPERLATGADGQALAESLEMDPDEMAAILWLLEATGLVHRRNPPAALVPVTAVATFVSAGKSGKKPSKKSAKRTRAKSSAGKRTRTKPVRKVKTAAPEAAAPTPPTPEVVAEVVAAKQATPSPPAPKKRKAAPKKRGPKPTLHRAQELIETEDFEAAYAMLSELRHVHPSCPDTLAALGWAGWRTGNHGTNAYDSPNDFLLLALTFDPAHTKALEYFARMAMDQGDVETARNRLLQLLQVDPDALWAREALEQGKFSSKSKGVGFGLRFWPKGKS